MTEDGPVVLWVEDEGRHIDLWMPRIKERWSGKSKAVRSRRAVRKALKSGDYTPDLAIIDRGILLSDDDDYADSKYGDAVYRELVGKELPIALVSADDLDVEPYLSTPPTLGFHTKPYTWELFERIVARFLEQQAGE